MSVGDIGLAARNAVALQRIDSANGHMRTFLDGVMDEEYTTLFGNAKTRVVGAPTRVRIAAGESALLDVRLAIAQLDPDSSAHSLLDRAAYEIDFGIGKLTKGETLSPRFTAYDGPRDEGRWFFAPASHLDDARYALQSEVRDARMDEVVALATRRTDEVIAELAASGTILRELPGAADDLATDLMAQNVRAAVTSN